MGKIKRYLHGCLEHQDGSVCLYSDVEKYLPPEKWPGKYPDGEGHWQFRHAVLCVVEVFILHGYFYVQKPGSDVWFNVSDTAPEQWGPRVYLWGEE